MRCVSGAAGARAGRGDGVLEGWTRGRRGLRGVRRTGV